jgi:putative endonuclease
LNWRNGRYEIDIIASRGGVLHFVEVKTRSVMGWGTPEQAMTTDKCRALLRAAALYISTHRMPHEPQFDLIAVDILPDGTADIRYTENVI